MRRRSPLGVPVVGLVLGLVPGLGAGSSAWGDGCAALCEQPERVTACQDGRPVWGFREPDGVCRGGSFGYLESHESADAERLRQARSQKRRCDESGECERFEALDAAQVVCLACDPLRGTPPEAGEDAREALGGRTPPCADDEWLRAGTDREAARCFVEFAALPPRLALQGRCTGGDCRSGSGTLRWPSGERYTGEFRSGRRHGQGSFRWPDGRAYVGEWRDGQPDGLGTRIYADGRYKAGYFERGRYRGPDLENRPVPVPPRPASGAAASTRSCEEACTEDAELQVGRIHDEYECCFARHAFCRQKAEIALEKCADGRCAAEAQRLRDECDLRYACDSVRTGKLTRYRRDRAACVEGCASQELDEQGLRVSERGTLVDDE